MHTIYVDFNDQTENGAVVGLVRGPGELHVGTLIYLRDNEGNTCDGRVKLLDGALAEVKPDWSTWRPVEPHYA